MGRQAGRVTYVALDGPAHSAGLEIALACDIRLASEGATFAMPDTAAGSVPRGGGTQRLPRAVGRGQALRLLLTGEVIDAIEAKRIGLVSRVVPLNELAGTSRALAEAIAARGPIATRLAKEAVHRGAEMTLEGFREFEAIRDFLYNRMRGVRASGPATSTAGTNVGASPDAELVDTLRAVATELRELRLALRSATDSGSPAPRPPS